MLSLLFIFYDHKRIYYYPYKGDMVVLLYQIIYNLWWDIVLYVRIRAIYGHYYV